MTKFLAVVVLLAGLLSCSLLHAIDHVDGEILTTKKNNGFLELLKPDKDRRIQVSEFPHISVSMTAKNTGWVYANSYIPSSATNCSAADVATQYGGATGVCLSVYGNSKYGNSVLFSCDGKTAQANYYNGTTCDPTRVLDQYAETANVCAADSGLGILSESDDYVVGISQAEIFCSTSTDFPLPGAYDWVLATTYDYTDTTCSQPVVYTAYRNNYCYTYTNGQHNYYSSSQFAYPNSYSYPDANCQVANAAGKLDTTCSPNTRSKENFRFLFVSNTVNPVASLMSFTSNITLTGVTTAYLASDSQLAVANATAASMKLPLPNVAFLNSYFIGANTAAVGAVTTEIVSVEVTATGTTYSLLASTKTSVELSNSGDANTLYTQYTTALENAVSSQQFTKSLQSASKTYNAVGTLTASGTQVQSSPAVITTVTEDSSSSSNGLSTGALAGIIVGSVVGAALLAGLIYYVVFVMMKSSSSLASQASNAPMTNIAGDSA